MPIYNCALPNFTLFPNSGNSGKFSNLDLTIKCPDEIVFNTITLKLKDDSNHTHFKDEYMNHYYSLYGIAWIKIRFNGIKYKCLECGKLYDHLNQLFPHINNHRNERLYKCKYCPKTYFSQKTLTWHTKKNHAETINYEFYCPICDKGYMKKYAFLRHLEAEAAK